MESSRDRQGGKMSKQAYYAARAIDERLQAQTATDARAAAAHLELSARYDALASELSLDQPADRRSMIEDVTEGLPGSEPSIAWSPTD